MNSVRDLRAGKSKTILLCGTITELSQSRAEIPKARKGCLQGDVTMKISRQFKEKLSLSLAHSHSVSFFFCQGTLRLYLVLGPRSGGVLCLTLLSIHPGRSAKDINALILIFLF